MKSTLVLIFLFLTSSFGFSQETGEVPQEPDLVLPEMVLQIRETELTEVQALLPSAEELPLPDWDLPLPEPAALAVRELSTEGLGNNNVVRPPTGTGIPAGTSSLFSQGILGAGTPTFLKAAISLYKLGEFPRFKLDFDHQSLDGYWFQNAYQPQGSYSFDRQDTLTGEFLYEDALNSLIVALQVTDAANGLQQISPYQSRGRRVVEFQGNWQRGLDDSWSFFTGAYGRFNTAFLSGTTPPVMEGARSGADLGFGLQTETFSGQFTTGFFSEYLGGNTPSGWENRLLPFWNNNLLMSWGFLPNWQSDFSGSLQWKGGIPRSEAIFSLSRASRDAWSMELEATWNRGPLWFFGLWEENPFLSPQGGDADQDYNRLAGNLELSFYPVRGHGFGLEGGLSWEEGGIYWGDLDSTFSLGTLVPREKWLAHSALVYTMELMNGFKMEQKLSYQWLDLNSEETPWIWNWDLEWIPTGGDWGLGLEQEWSLENSVEATFPEDSDWNLPVWNAEVFWKFNEALTVRGKVQDFFSSFLYGGRQGFMTRFLQPGFNLSLFAEISF